MCPLVPKIHTPLETFPQSIHDPSIYMNRIASCVERHDFHEQKTTRCPHRTKSGIEINLQCALTQTMSFFLVCYAQLHTRNFAVRTYSSVAAHPREHARSAACPPVASPSRGTEIMRWSGGGGAGRAPWRRR
jgi:hypothetical protein